MIGHGKVWSGACYTIFWWKSKHNAIVMSPNNVIMLLIVLILKVRRLFYIILWIPFHMNNILTIKAYCNISLLILLTFCAILGHGTCSTYLVLYLNGKAKKKKIGNRFGPIKLVHSRQLFYWSALVCQGFRFSLFLQF